MYMLKAVAESIAPTLAILFSLSLSSSKFPSLWKSALFLSINRVANQMQQITGQSHYSQLSASCLRNMSTLSYGTILLTKLLSQKINGDSKQASQL